MVKGVVHGLDGYCVGSPMVVVLGVILGILVGKPDGDKLGYQLGRIILTVQKNKLVTVKVTHYIEYSIQYLYMHWGVDACLLGVGLKWIIITDVLFVSGYFPAVSHLVYRNKIMV